MRPHSQKGIPALSMLPMMVTPIVDPVVQSPGTPSSYPTPPLPALTRDEQIPVSETSPLREVAGSPVLDVFPSYMTSPAGSVYGPVTSRISPSLREDDVSRPPSSPATMDQYLPRELLLGESTDASDSSSDCRGDGSGVGCGLPGLVSRGPL